MPHDLIVFGEDWGGLPSSTQHLIKRLAKNRQVLWVNSIGLRQPKLCLRDIHRVIHKVIKRVSTIFSTLNVKTNTVDTPANLHVINPLTIPAPKSNIARTVAAFLLRQQIRPNIKNLKLNKPILWISVPTAADLIGDLDEYKVIYYCGDDFSGLAGVDHQTVVNHEAKLIEHSHLIITASDALCNKFSTAPSHPLCRTLTHGVDFELFSTPVERAHDLPSNTKPIAGFYGSLSHWLDIDMLADVIGLLPHWNFVFIGKQEADMTKIYSLDNAYFLGPKPHHELPKYVQHWQASMLPFRDNAQIRACNPLKLSEYIAAGIPIVSTKFPAVQQHCQFVQIAQTADTFAEALELSPYVIKLSHFRNTLQQRVTQHTWTQKAHIVDEWIEQL